MTDLAKWQCVHLFSERTVDVDDGNIDVEVIRRETVTKMERLRAKKKMSSRFHKEILLKNFHAVLMQARAVQAPRHVPATEGTRSAFLSSGNINVETSLKKKLETIRTKRRRGRAITRYSEIFKKLDETGAFLGSQSCTSEFQGEAMTIS